MMNFYFIVCVLNNFAASKVIDVDNERCFNDDDDDDDDDVSNASRSLAG